jgi:hypothetical protein
MWPGSIVAVVSLVDEGSSGRVAVPSQVSVGVLAVTVPWFKVADAVAACGVREKRSDGTLPAHVVAYLTMGLCLFADDPYEEVATKVTGSLAEWGCWNAAWPVPTSSAITQARKRLGREVVKDLFYRVAEPVAESATRGARLRGWRLTAVDGFELDVPDSKENAAEFGYAGSEKSGNRSAFPKARVVAVAECGTHAFLDAEVSGIGVGEKTLAGPLLDRLGEDWLLTADRGFYSFDAWGRALRSGADLLWRAPTQLRLPLVAWLPDGTYLSVLIKPGLREAARNVLIEDAKAGRELDPERAHLVRVVEYDVPDRDSDELICLITSITDPAAARADELASAYHQRWEEETGNDQLKTHLRGPGRVLRSRLPDLVHQEIWAYLLTHHALAALISRAATAADIDPDRVSFARALNIVRRSSTGTAAFPP